MAKLCDNKNGGQYRKAQRQRQGQPENYPAREKGAAHSFQAAFGIGIRRRAAKGFQAACSACGKAVLSGFRYGKDRQFLLDYTPQQTACAGTERRRISTTNRLN